MNYEQALEYIHSTKKHTTKPGLTRVENLLNRLGDPHRAMRYVHIAGTNGKGSATAMTASVLQTAGFRTGAFISPYLERFNERMQINGVPITDNALAELTTRVKPFADAIEADGQPHPTEFELITAMAFEFWRSGGCDWVSLEVGMGGRLDATNVIDAPDVAIITSLSFDHTHYLGNTIEEIAYEKCGIIKPGSSLVCYAEQPEAARRVIIDTCRERGCEFIQPDVSTVQILSADLTGSRFTYDGLEVFVPLMGRHQVINAIGVIEAMRALRRRGHAVTDGDITRGIAATEWVGRLEPVRAEPYTVIDAAHNPDAVKVLCDSVDTLFRDREIVAVMGILADKDYNTCIPEIAKRCHTFIATTPASGRALPAAETAEVACRYCGNVETVEDICDAVDRATELSRDGKMILICGSLFVAGIAKTHIKSNPIG